MGNHHFPIPVKMSAAAIVLIFCGAAFAEQKTSGVLPDVLIQAEENRPILREKPPLEPDLKEDSPLEADLQLEDELRQKLPTDIEKAKTFTPGQSESALTAVPATNWIVLAAAGEPARVFYPLKELQSVYPAGKEEKDKSSWEFNVIDNSGKVFRRFAGAGKPPEKLEFDGRSDDGEWLRVGQDYTGLLIFKDSNSRAHTAMGKAFAVAGLSVDGKRGPVISLAPKMLFETPNTPNRLSSTGKDLLREAAQLIQRFYPGLGLQIEANLSRSENAAVQGAADLCAKDLAKRLALLPSAVASIAHPATPDLEERIDVLVVNR